MGDVVEDEADSARSRSTSKALAPRARSSLVVKSSSTPTGVRVWTRCLAQRGIVATAALSAPRIPSLRLRKIPSSRTTSTGAASGTVSMWAQSRIVRAPRGREPGEHVARIRARLGAAVVLLDLLEPERAQLGDHRIRHRALVARRALDLAETGELGEEPLALLRRGPTRELLGPRARPGAPARAAAATNSRPSGCGRGGRDLNSGWNWEATKNGWSRLGDLHQPVVRRGARAHEPACSSRLRRWLLTS